MPVSGGNIWSFECKILEGYIVTSQRSYYPKARTKSPEEAVQILKEDTSATVWVPLYGMNQKNVVTLWYDTKNR